MGNLTLKELGRRAFETAKAKGFHDEPIDLPRALMLTVSELAEALEADRKQKTADRMPFGSYKGEVIAKVPAEYLLAMYESGKCPANVQEYVEQNMAELHLRAERDGRCRNALKSMYL